MKPTYSMPFYLWIGILGLVLSVVIPAVIGMFRKKKMGQGEASVLLTPLQVKILDLTREFRLLLAELPEPKEPVNASPSELEEWTKQHTKWSTSLLFAYKERFLGRLQPIVNSLGRLGIVGIDTLESHVAPHHQSELAWRDLVRRLLEVVLRLEGRAENGRVEISFEEPEPVPYLNNLIELGKSVDGGKIEK